MGFVTDILGGSSGAGFQASGTKIETPVDAAGAQIAQRQNTGAINSQGAFAQAVAAQNGLGNQSNVFNQLQGVANGTGPNPAQAQLNQATGANVANQAALMAGQRGAGANAGLLARLAAQQGGALQQQAVGQGATMQANQSLNALNQLGGIAGQQVGQQQAAISNYGNATQANQNSLLNQIQSQNNANVQMQSNINSANAGIAQGNQKSQSDLLGGGLGGLASGIALLAHGGSVPGYAAGGGVAPAQPQSFAAKYFSQMGGAPQTGMSGAGVGASALGQAIGNLFHSTSQAPAAIPSRADEYAMMTSPQQHLGDPLATSEAAMMMSPEQHLGAPIAESPMLVNDPMQMSTDAGPMIGNTMVASRGGKVPGRAQVQGDSYANDTVNAKLSPGEIVIPRSILEGKNPVQMAAQFVKQEMLKQHKSKKNAFADGGTATADDQKPVVVNVNNGPPQPEAPQDPAAAFYAQRQAALESKNPAFRAEAVDPRPADFYAQRKADAAAGVPYQPGVAPLVPGTPGPLLASNGPAPTANTLAPQMMHGELSGNGVSASPLAAAAGQEAGLIRQAMGEQLAGAKGEAAAAQQLAQSQAAIAKAEQEKLQQQQVRYQDNYNKLETERQKFATDIEQGHIDPKKYMGEMSTGQKFSTAIGLILGGMGGALTHQENPALKFLNNQIENDINAQKANLDKKQNLLSMNMKQFGNLDQATNMTRIMLATSVEAQMKEAAAKAADPMAKARMQQAIGQLHEKYAPLMAQTAKKQAMLQGLGSGGGGTDPAQLVPLFVPKEEQEGVFKEIQHSQNLRKSKQQILEAFDKASSQFKGVPWDRSGVKAFKALIAANLGEVEGSVREAAMHAADQNLTPQFFDGDLKTKRKSVENWITTGMAAPRAKAYGIDLDKFDSTSHKAEPETAMMGGVKFQKVNGGWKRAI